MTITCADCGSTQTIPALPRGGTAECHRCHRVLHRHAGVSVDVTLACAVAMLVLLPPAVFMPLMDSSIQNLVFEESRLVSSVPVIYSEVWFPFAFGFLFLAFLFPFLRALFLTVVLTSIRSGYRIWQRGRLFRWEEELRVWAMTDVVVIAGSIAYFRASIPADVALRPGAFCYLSVAILALVADLSLDRRLVWNAIYPDPEKPAAGIPCDACELAVTKRRTGDSCPRCGAVLDRSIGPRYAPALTAIAAAVPLTIPAYAASIMINDQLTAVIEHTVIGTVQLLADRGYWSIGTVILIAGVVIPISVLGAMIWLLLRVRFPRREGLVLRTRVYRLMHRLVRWPMIIPFIAAIAAPIVDFRGIDDIVSGPGATPLFALITLLMIAVRVFRPRLMWKTAGAPA